MGYLRPTMRLLFLGESALGANVVQVEKLGPSRLIDGG